MPKRKHSSKSTNDASNNDNIAASSKRLRGKGNASVNDNSTKQSTTTNAHTSTPDYTPFVYVNIYVYRDGIPYIKEKDTEKHTGGKRKPKRERYAPIATENHDEANADTNENASRELVTSSSSTSIQTTRNDDAHVPVYVSIRPSHINSTTHKYQPLAPLNAYMSPLCAAPRLRISTSNRIVYGEKGYRSIRATHGIVEGSWYWEARILQPKASIRREIINSLPHEVDYTDPHVRVGWSTEKGDLHAPVGYDRHGYGYIDHNGYKYHESYPAPYGQSFTAGDIIGCHIYLPSLHEYLLKVKNFDLHGYEQAQITGNKDDMEQYNTSSYTTTISTLFPRLGPKRKKKKGKSKSEIADENDKPSITSLSPAEIELYRQRSETYVLGSEITYYKNGVSQGVAFSDILRSTYMPTISLYMGAGVEVNFGPYYISAPPELYEDSSSSGVKGSGLYPQFIDSTSTIKRNPVIPIDKVGIQPIDDGKGRKKKKELLD